MANQAVKTAVKAKKKARVNVTEGVVHVYATFNNTIITLSDRQGNVLAWSSAGACGFKGSRKSTPFAAQIAAEKVGNVGKERGVKNVEIWVRGPGPGRDAAGRTFGSMGYKIVSLVDVTPIPHNGCRPRKKRRV